MPLPPPDICLKRLAPQPLCSVHRGYRAVLKAPGPEQKAPPLSVPFPAGGCPCPARPARSQDLSQLLYLRPSGLHHDLLDQNMRELFPARPRHHPDPDPEPSGTPAATDCICHPIQQYCSILCRFLLRCFLLCFSLLC